MTFAVEAVRIEPQAAASLILDISYVVASDINSDLKIEQIMNLFQEWHEVVLPIWFGQQKAVQSE